MYAGGFHSEYHIFLSVQEGENDDFGYKTWLYFLAMVLVAVASIMRQLADRRTHLDAYKYKSRFSAYESYQQMRAKYGRQPQNDSGDGYSDLDKSNDKQE